MLAALSINNIVLIDRLNIEFQPGFCALTGETGAGKSILLDALGLALGVRAESGLVRKGAGQATVSAEFHIAGDHPANALLHHAGLEGGSALILRRALGADGRSRAFINDQPVSIALLRQVGEALVEIHGQFDTQGLLDPSTHGVLLDDYAGIDGSALADLWQDWRRTQQVLDDAKAQAAKAQAEESYLRGAVEDLDDLNPQDGEEEKLAVLKDKLRRRDKILESLSVANDGLSVAEESINAAWKAIERAGENDLLGELSRVLSDLRDIAAGAQSRFADLQDSEDSLEEIDDRLHALRAQARKLNCACDDLPRVRDDLARQLSLIERQDEMLDELKKAVVQARAIFVRQAEKIRAQRLGVAEKLDRLVAKELPPLKLDKARFVTEVMPLEETQWGPAGTDRVRFLVATNPGAEPGALDKIASGGEMARFMLALKVVMAETGSAGTYIFDEVDSGIGGGTAAAVGDRLARLAAVRQIIVVTHSPQVAARAKHHYIVLKSGGKNVTTTVMPLAEAYERREEIARMLAGAEITTEARAAAEKLLG